MQVALLAWPAYRVSLRAPTEPENMRERTRDAFKEFDWRTVICFFYKKIWKVACGFNIKESLDWPTKLLIG